MESNINTEIIKKVQKRNYVKKFDDLKKSAKEKASILIEEILNNTQKEENLQNISYEAKKMGLLFFKRYNNNLCTYDKVNVFEQGYIMIYLLKSCIENSDFLSCFSIKDNSIEKEIEILEFYLDKLYQDKKNENIVTTEQYAAINIIISKKKNKIYTDAKSIFFKIYKEINF